MVEVECDVLVVGCGAAGLTSALAALESGASVIVLERSPIEHRGGNTRWTEALLRLKGGVTPDFEISDDFVESYAAQAGHHIAPAQIAESARARETWSPILRTLPYLDPEVLDAFASSVPPTLKWLEGHGIRFRVMDYPFIFPAPLIGIYGGGEALIETLAPIVERALLPPSARDRALSHVIEDWADESLYIYEIEMRLAWRHNLLPLVPSFAATMPGVPEHDVADFVEKAAKAMTTAQGLGRKPVEQVLRDADRHLQAIDGLVGDGDWLVGSHLSIADLSVVPQLNALLCTREVVAAVTKLPRTMAWRQRVMDAAPDNAGRRSEPVAKP